MMIQVCRARTCIQASEGVLVLVNCNDIVIGVDHLVDRDQSAASQEQLNGMEDAVNIAGWSHSFCISELAAGCSILQTAMYSLLARPWFSSPAVASSSSSVQCEYQHHHSHH